MYRLEWIEARKHKQVGSPNSLPGSIHPIVWKLGFTSLLTDISSEMVHSLLPVYLVLHLHMSPLQFGTIDGIYSGMAMAMLALAGGFLADRTRRPKEVAAFGYAVSAVCKLLFLIAGAAWGWIAAIVAFDRTGKGFRTAPRDAMISLCNPADSLATAFAVHRALDAGGALFGPIVAFVLLSQRPGSFDAIWLTSFAFALLGLAVLLLFVQNPSAKNVAHQPRPVWHAMRMHVGSGFWKLSIIGALLSIMTISDGFFYLLLQKRTGLAMGFFPLFYIITACAYMLLSIPLREIRRSVWAEVCFLFWLRCARCYLRSSPFLERLQSALVRRLSFAFRSLLRRDGRCAHGHDQRRRPGGISNKRARASRHADQRRKTDLIASLWLALANVGNAERNFRTRDRSGHRCAARFR